ncbi:MAG TPA: hydroxymethylbilane synthase [Acidimicrobiia bacterium]|nr:hydroxymethylbilane synthase [Acidimicrobiia bacterium]
MAGSRPALRVATRGSALARLQTDAVARRLGLDVEVVVVQTTGDRRADVPIHTLGGTGVFVKEVEDAVLRGDADLAVHSAKDLPSTTAPGLVLAAVPERADPRDAVVGSTLDTLPAGALVATGSVRRRAQLANLRPDLTFAELRGNIGTRLDKAAGFDAVVIAAAALDRLSAADRIGERLDPALVLPQVGQGALAVECRADDDTTRALLASIDDPAAHAAVDAERAFLERLGGGCNLPCGALATLAGPSIAIEAVLATLDGRVLVRARATGTDATAAGREVASRLLDEHGGRALLEDVA